MRNISVPVTASIQNPDKDSIQSKNIIDMSLSDFDISASGYTNVASLNFKNNEMVIYLDSTTTTGSLYYTPLYVEKINYEIWKKRINKSFKELGLT